MRMGWKTAGVIVVDLSLGSVALVRSQDAKISTRATSDADLVVLPDELLIRNGRGTMDVLVSGPPTVTDTGLRISGVQHTVSLVGGAAYLIILIR